MDHVEWFRTFPEKDGITLMHPSVLWNKCGDPNGPGLELIRASYVGFILPQSWALIQEREQIGNPNDKLACQLRKAAEDYEAKVENAVHGYKISFEVIDPADGETKSKAGFFVDLTGGWIVQPKLRTIQSVIREKPQRATVILKMGDFKNLTPIRERLLRRGARFTRTTRSFGLNARSDKL
jgi:hypothetical protein